MIRVESGTRSELPTAVQRLSIATDMLMYAVPRLATRSPNTLKFAVLRQRWTFWVGNRCLDIRPLEQSSYWHAPPWPQNIIIIIIIIAVENLGVFSSTTLNFISELGRRICVHTGDARETLYLFQRISNMLQRFNFVLLHDTLPVDLPDLWPSDILILAFVVFNPGDLYYLGYKFFFKFKKSNNNKQICIAL